MELLLTRLSKVSVVGREGYVSHLIVRGIGEVDLLFLLEGKRRRNDRPIYSEIFVFLTIYIIYYTYKFVC